MTNKERVQTKRIQEAIEVIKRYGGIDGTHHKQWILDQVLQKLMTDKEYKKFVETRSEGPDGMPGYYDDWDTGTPP